MFKQEQRGVMAGGFENQETNTFVSEETRIGQMGFEPPTPAPNEIKDIDPEKLKKTRIKTSFYSLGNQNMSHIFDPSVTFNILPAADVTALDVEISTAIKPEFHRGIENMIRLFLYDDLSSGGNNYSYSMAFDYSKLNYSLLSNDPKIAGQLQTDYGSSVRGLRFSYEKGESASKPKIHAEDIGLIAPYKRPDENTKKLWQEKFDLYGFYFSDENGAWQEEEKEITMKTIYGLPDAHLQSLKGMKFKREVSQKKENDNEAANYNTNHSLTIKNWAFVDNPAMYGSSLFTGMQETYIPEGKTEAEKRPYTPATSDTVFGNETDGFKGNLEKSIVHEIGHAVDQANLLAVKAEYVDIQTRKSNVFTEYLVQPYLDLEKKYGKARFTVKTEKFESGRYKSATPVYSNADTEIANKVTVIKASHEKKKSEMQKLYDNKKSEFLNTYSESGGRKGNVTDNSYGIIDNDPPKETKFQEAVKADGQEVITDYSGSKPTAGENALEHFAESYSLYMNDRERFKLMRPNLFLYFSTNKLPSDRTK